jgi:CHAT domain-containing protein/Tfp pilus assembly protein PilF
MAQSKKILVSVVFVVICALLALLLMAPFPEEPEEKKVPLGRGVVVETVREGSAFDRAGLLPGDILRAWERLPNSPANPKGASGPIESIFDWMWVEEEQGPRGEIRLIGERDREPREFHVPMGFGYGRIRPLLSSPVEAQYLQGVELLDTDRIEEGIGNWEKATDLAREERGGGDDLCWLLLEIGKAERRWLRDPKQAQSTFHSALQEATNITARVSALRGLGKSYRDQRLFDEARRALETALAEIESMAGESLSYANVLVNLGILAQHEGELDLAETFENRALEVRRKLAPVSFDVGQSLINLAGLAIRRGGLRQAQQYLEQELAIEQKLLSGSLQEATTLINLGRISWERGDYEVSERFYQKALTIRRRFRPESLAVADVLSNMGAVARDQGRWRLALDRHRQALKLRQVLAPRSARVAQSLVNIGAVLHDTGDLAEAEAHYRRAIEILEVTAPESSDLALALSNLGTVVLARGDLARARDLFRRGLAIREDLAPMSLDVAICLTHLGEVALRLGDFKTARSSYERALRIREQKAPQSILVAQSLYDLGMLALKRNALTDAASTLPRALEIRRDHAPISLATASSFHSLGDLEAASGNLNLALAHYREALSIRQRIALGSREEAETLHGIGEVLQAKGLLQDALEAHLASLEALETQFRELGGSYTQKALFRSRYNAYYRQTIELLLELGEPEQAFTILERWRARSFLTLLSERAVALPGESDPSLEQHRQRLATRYDQIQRELDRLDQREHPRKTEALLVQLRAVRDRIDQLSTSAHDSRADDERRLVPEPLDLAGVRNALDPGTVLLSYFVAEDQTILFSIGADGQLQVAKVGLGGQSLHRLIGDFRQAIGRDVPGAPNGAQRSRIALGKSLYRALIEPVEGLVSSGRRLLILPDGPLRLLPWAALIRKTNDQRATAAKKWNYLMEWIPLHTSLSATVFAELKKGRGGASLQKLRLAAFGDPLYPQSQGEKETLTRGAASLRSAVERGLFDWQPLPNTRTEVESISKLFRRDRVRTFLGEKATEEAVKAMGSNSAASPEILHIAAHGNLDDRFPLNSALVLSLPESTEAGKDNGLLQGWEILQEVRLNTDLVVLSACDTALGKDLGGEGLIGLTQAFQFAGARSVVASLWKIKDEATSELMVRFYHHLQAGLTKDRALQTAQLDLIQQGASGSNLASPYFWAGFQIDGDWR